MISLVIVVSLGRESMVLLMLSFWKSFSLLPPFPSLLLPLVCTFHGSFVSHTLSGELILRKHFRKNVQTSVWKYCMSGSDANGWWSGLLHLNLDSKLVDCCRAQVVLLPSFQDWHSYSERDWTINHQVIIRPNGLPYTHKIWNFRAGNGYQVWTASLFYRWEN